MSFIKFENVKISGIACKVPKQKFSFEESNFFKSSKDVKKFSKITGIKEKRHADNSTTTLDLCLDSANQLISELDWDKAEIDLIVFVTQTPDYPVPNNAIIFQDRLGIKKDSMCFDVPLGCSGYVYGLSIVFSLMEKGFMKKALLAVGDTLSKQANPKDKSTYPLFGDAGSVTALEYDYKSSDSEFYLWSDGSGYDKIIVESGGYRNPINSESIIDKVDLNGNIRKKVNTYMDGGAVASFTMTEVPDQIKKFFDLSNKSNDDYDYFIMHQANKFLNENIRKKIGFEERQTLYSMGSYGNTSSTTIPLTICCNQIDKSSNKLLICGFGVGLSIGIASIEINSDFKKIMIDEFKK